MTTRVVFALLLAGTFAGWWVSDNGIRALSENRFHARVLKIEHQVHDRMLVHEQILRGGVGLFRASENVTREEWRTYVTGLDLGAHYPGIQGMGWSVRIRPDELGSHQENIRGEGYPDYAVWPDSPARDEYHAIIYLEPFSGRNIRAFGYDMHSESMRREAMDRARDEGKVAVSGLVKLVQETETDVQPGFLMYLPVYRKNAPAGTVEERRAAFLGLVYSPFRARDLMTGILDPGVPDLGFEIFDGAGVDPEKRLFDSHRGESDSSARGHGILFHTNTIVIGGRAWTIRYHSQSDYLSTEERLQPLLLAAAGLMANLLLVIIMGLRGSIQRRAVAMAEAMTTELSRSREELRNAQKIAKMASWSWEPDSGHVEWSDEMYPLLGADKKLVPPSFDFYVDHVHPEDRAQTLERLRTAAGLPGSYQSSHRLIRSDGEVREVEVRYEVTGTGGGRFTVKGVLIDITDRVRVEAALRESERLYRTLFEKASDGIFYLDMEGKIVAVNEEFARMHGYTTDAMLRMSLRDLDTPETAREAPERMRRIFAGETLRFEVEHFHRNGQRLPLEVSASLLMLEGKNFVLAFHRDITEKRRLEAEVRQAEKLAALGRLATGISHEMNQPLNAIRNFCQGLLLNYEDGIEVSRERLRDTLSRVVEQVDRMSEIVKSMKVFSRKETVVTAERIDLNRVAAYPFTLLGAQLRSRGVAVKCEFANEPVTVTANAPQLEQVMVNLVVNARDAVLERYPSEGGVIAVRTKLTEREGMKWAVIEVEDNGTGVDPSHLEKIFEPFFTTKGPDLGTGLGLPLSYEIVLAHGGSLKARSRLDEGSIFTIELPYAEEA